MSFAAETTIRLGCEYCPEKREISTDGFALQVLAGIDTSGAPLRCTEEIVQVTEVAVFDGYRGSVKSIRNTAHVEKRIGPAEPCEVGECQYSSTLKEIGQQVSIRVRELIKEGTGKQ